MKMRDFLPSWNNVWLFSLCVCIYISTFGSRPAGYVVQSQALYQTLMEKLFIFCFPENIQPLSEINVVTGLNIASFIIIW